MKNRFPDILPFDQNSVRLPSTKDDYINASFIKELSSSNITFIATQAPLPSTYEDFWHMIWSENVELIVCLVGDIDVSFSIDFGNIFTFFTCSSVVHSSKDTFIGQTRRAKKLFSDRSK